MPGSEHSDTFEVRWVPTDPHGALPGHHWQGTLTKDGAIVYQRRYFKRWLALADLHSWVAEAVEVEQELDRIREGSRS